MGHFIFIVLHVIAVLFVGVVLLFITIPLHIIYAATRRTRDKPKPQTHVICPSCRELVHKQASVCRHCRQVLVPQK